MPWRRIACCTLFVSCSLANSGVCTPTTTRPRCLYFSCHCTTCGSVWTQLMQPYVQKSTITTWPRSAAMLSGSELSQVSIPTNSGAAREPPPARQSGAAAASDSAMRVVRFKGRSFQCGRRRMPALRLWSALRTAPYTAGALRRVLQPLHRPAEELELPADGAAAAADRKVQGQRSPLAERELAILGLGHEASRLSASNVHRAANQVRVRHSRSAMRARYRSTAPGPTP